MSFSSFALMVDSGGGSGSSLDGATVPVDAFGVGLAVCSAGRFRELLAGPSQPTDVKRSSEPTIKNAPSNRFMVVIRNLSS